MTSRKAVPTLTELSHFGILLALLFGLTMAGCDSTGVGGGGGADSATISGRVTDNSSSGSSALLASSKAARARASQGGVEGAVVTAVRVRADGSTRPLEGEATTNASGEFTINVKGEGATDVVRLKAEGENGFSSSVIVQVDGKSQLSAQPMTAETKAEAEVFLEAKAEDEASSPMKGVTAADVALRVNADAASAINAGATAAEEVAAAIAASVRAETQMNGTAEGGAEAEAVADVKADLFAELQSGLATASSANARARVVSDFENGMANLFVEAGGSAESQAQSRQASTSIMIEFSGEASSNAELGLRRQAELLRAEATARAEEAIFEAEGASSSTIDALVQARQQLKADIRAASSTSAMVEAHSAFEAEVKSQMEAAFGLSSALITAAETKIEGNVETLFAALADVGGVLSGVVETTINAYSSFYSNAQAAAEASFEGSVNSKSTAEAAAEALVFASAQGHAS